jgi:Fe-S-cluster containining protein
MSGFTCYRCIHCCFFSEEKESPVLLWHEVLYLSKLGELMSLKLNFKNLGQGFYRLVFDGFCPFYDVGNRACRIQKEKPLACRMFPLLINISSLELTVSLICPWIRENFARISKDLTLEDIENIFHEEFKALREVIEWVYNVSRSTPKTAIYFTTYYKDLAQDIISKLRERYVVMKVSESSVVDGFYYILLDGDIDRNDIENMLKQDEITWYKIEKVPPIT